MDSQGESPLYKAEIEHKVAVALHGSSSPQAADAARKLQEQQQAEEASLPVARRVQALEKRRADSDKDLERRELALNDFEAKLMTLHNEMDTAREAFKRAQHDHQVLLSNLRAAQEEARQAQASEEEIEDSSSQPRRPEDLLREMQDMFRYHPAMVEGEFRDVAIEVHQGFERLITSMATWAAAAGVQAQHDDTCEVAIDDP